MAEVWWRGCTADFVWENCKFVVKLLMNREPVKLFQERLSRRSSRHLKNDACPYSGLAAVSGCCRPGLHATWRYSSPGATAWGCRPESEPAQWSVDDEGVKWPGCDSCRLSLPLSHGCRKSGDFRAPHRESSSRSLPVDQRRRRTRTTWSTWRLAADWITRWWKPPTSRDWAANHSAGTTAWRQRYRRQGRWDHWRCCWCAWTVVYRWRTDDIWRYTVRWRQPPDCSTQQTTVGRVPNTNVQSNSIWQVLALNQQRVVDSVEHSGQIKTD